MTPVLLLCRHDLEKSLDFASVIEALEAAFQSERAGLWDTPKRIAAHAKGGGLLAMPCGGGSPEALGAKLVSTFAGNGALGLPSVSGLYALFDPSTGAPLAVMDGAYLTLVRTAAVSALATRVMASPDASSLGIFGAGAQAEFHVRLLATVRPIRKVAVWARDSAAAAGLIARLRALPELHQVHAWVAASRAEEAATSDLVVTATGAVTPILEGAWLREGGHVVAVGAHTRATREMDTAAVTRATTLVVETSDTLLEAGDFQMAENETGGVVLRVTTLGSFMESIVASPPRDPRAISIFKSCGVAFEDLAVASLALQRARDLGLGARFAFS